MELEVCHGEKLTREFKIEAVRLERARSPEWGNSDHEGRPPIAACRSYGSIRARRGDSVRRPRPRLPTQGRLRVIRLLAWFTVSARSFSIARR